MSEVLTSPHANQGRHRTAEGRHRAKEHRVAQALRSASLLLRGHSSGSRSERAASKARRAPIHPEVRVASPGLEYQGHKERLTDNYVSLTAHKPLLRRAQVRKQLGADLGALRGVIHLPSAERLYCFDQSYFNGKQERVGSFLFLNPQQLEMVQSRAQTGQPSWDEITQGALYLHRDPEAIENPHARQTIGRSRWLPGRSANREYYPASTPPEYHSLGDRECTLYINGTGSLIVGAALESKGTVLELNADYVTPRDPWAQR